MPATRLKLGAIAWRNIHRNRRRSLLSALAMLVVTAALITAFSILEGMKADMSDNVFSFTYGQLRIANPDYDKNHSLNPIHLNVPDGEATTRWLESQPEILTAAPRVSFGALIQRGDRRHQALGWGVDFTREAAHSRLDRLLKAGRLPSEGTKETAIGTGLARTLGVGVGDKFTFMTTTRNHSMNGVTLTVTGLLDFPVGGLSSLVFVTPIAKAADWLQMDGACLQILARVRPGTDLAALTARLDRELRPRGLAATNWTQSSAVYAIVQVVEGIYNIIAVMFILLGSAVVINTTMMVVFERRAEIGALGAMGMRPDELVRLFLIEAVCLSVLGAAAGTVLGCGLSSLFAWTGLDLSVLMAGIDVEFPTVLHPVLDLRSVLGSLAMIIVLSGLASLLPSWMAARIQPVDALRS